MLACIEVSYTLSFLHGHGEGQSPVRYLFVLHASAAQLANRMSSVAMKSRGIRLSSCSVRITALD